MHKGNMGKKYRVSQYFQRKNSILIHDKTKHKWDFFKAYEKPTPMT